MKRFVCVIAAAALLLGIFPAAAFAHTAADPFKTDMIAGGGNVKSAMDAGDVLVWNDANNIYVKYMASGGWMISETHLSIKTSMAEIPQNNGNPIPGKFKYKGYHDPMVDAYTYVVPKTWPVGTKLYIAAHSVVMKPCVDGGGGGGTMPCDMLPAQVTEMVSQPGPNSYFVTTVSGGTVLDGVYDGWCINTGLRLFQGEPRMADVYCSLSALPAGIVDKPQNMDLVNWVLNQGYVGTMSPGGYGMYTWSDIQRAIWELLDNEPDGTGLGVWDPMRVAEITAGAMATGEGFMPAAGQCAAIVLVPRDASGNMLQPNIVCKPYMPPPPPECGDETAWGKGPGFPGSNWAMYFCYTVQ